MANNPVAFVFVPGAWHTPELAFTSVFKLLGEQGYATKGVPLASVGGSPLPGFGPDVEEVRKAILEALDTGADVAVVSHSYGGLPASHAVEGLGKEERVAAGHKNGIVKLIFVCSFAADVGVSLFDAIGGGPLPWMHWADAEPSSNDGTNSKQEHLRATNSEEIFYNDLPPDVQQDMIKRLQLHAAGSMREKATFAGWKHIPSAYLICNLDNAIPAAAQEQMVQQPGKWDLIERIDASHTPMVSKSQETAAFLIKAIS